MKNIHEFMEWAASHAVLRESDGVLYVDKSIIGTDPWKYLYGTSGRLCTQSLLDSKYSAYYGPWGWSKSAYDKATEGWAGNVTVCDCQGLEDCFSGADTNAKGNYALYCTQKGAISEIARPYVYGEALFCGKTERTINHVAWVIGSVDGEPIIIHERGLKDGCVIERLSRSGKKFTFRGIMDKRYIYTVMAEESPVQEVVDEPDNRVLSLTSPMLRGDDVKALQERLDALGYTVGVMDGIYGKKTDAAVRLYQAFAVEVVPGVVDEATKSLLGL